MLNSKPETQNKELLLMTVASADFNAAYSCGAATAWSRTVFGCRTSPFSLFPLSADPAPPDSGGMPYIYPTLATLSRKFQERELLLISSQGWVCRTRPSLPFKNAETQPRRNREIPRRDRPRRTRSFNRASRHVKNKIPVVYSYQAWVTLPPVIQR